jgi:ribosome-binding protein aMBF1 (putative translation factor)
MVTVIRLARVKAGLSLRDFARKHKFPESAFCRVERGQAYVPPNWRKRLAKALGLSIEEICDLTTGWPKIIR